MPYRLLFLLLVTLIATGASATPRLESRRALVMDATTGEVLLAKGATEVASIASLTKLMTAMVVLDADLSPFEVFDIETADLDTIKGTQSGVPVGSRFTRRSLVRLALLSSDNRAAAALARTFPGGNEAFQRAVSEKIRSLGLTSTSLVEPTGLSPHNRSSAVDMIKVLKAAIDYPLIAEITSQATAKLGVNGVDTVFRNTNRLVGRTDWRILVSKTGFTREAGVCLTMAFEQAGRRVLVVLMGADASDERARDAISIRRWVAGEPPLLREAQPATGTSASVKRAAYAPGKGKTVSRSVRQV